MDKTNNIKYDGIWQFSEIIEDSSNQPTLSGLTDQYTFIIENGLITVSLLADQLSDWKAEDDVYILKSKWISKTLFYKPPVGDWTPLADFNGEVFFMSDGKRKRIFRKIVKDEVVKWNAPILKADRLPFKYDS